jgi:hypothetical protein
MVLIIHLYITKHNPKQPLKFVCKLSTYVMLIKYTKIVIQIYI